MNNFQTFFFFFPPNKLKGIIEDLRKIKKKKNHTEERQNLSGETLTVAQNQRIDFSMVMTAKPCPATSHNELITLINKVVLRWERV